MGWRRDKGSQLSDSKCPYQQDEENNTTNANTPRDPKSAILDFLRSIPSSFNASFWPLSFSIDAISSSFSDLLPYVAKAAELSPDFASEAGAVIADVVITASARSSDADGIARDFLTALSRNCPPLPAREAHRLVGCLLEEFLQAEGAAASVSESVSSLQILPSSSSSQSSPMATSTASVRFESDSETEGGREGDRAIERER